tara:strand:- start:564 stop:887 length:324 start_codon:yes stop_codon:yes gene_type:complete
MMVLSKILKIQRRARIYIEKVRAVNAIRTERADIIKKFAKGALARKKVKEYRHVAKCTALIQRFYHARHKGKVRAATTVKKFAKGLKVYNRYQRLKKVRQATKDILD